jgi:BirA family biotin operon repressor/biotin-[acetyl-CoA-carboxylase] ligase
MSVLLRPGPDPALAQFIPMAAALSLRVCLHGSGVPARLAWPNDLVARGRKLAGLLAESGIRGAELEYVILGMGINVNNNPDSLPEELRGAAISCAQIAGAPLGLETLAADLLNAFEPLCDEIARGRGGRIFEEWKTALELIGERVSVRNGDVVHEGVVLDVATEGALVLRLDNNETAAIPMDRGSLHTNKYSKEL